jgi:hypothetical protein
MECYEDRRLVRLTPERGKVSCDDEMGLSGKRKDLYSVSQPTICYIGIMNQRKPWSHITYVMSSTPFMSIGPIRTSDFLPKG